MSKLFTSFIAKDDSCYEFYSKKLIPLWLKINKRFSDDITIVTNIPESFGQFDIKIHYLKCEEAFFGRDARKYNPMTSQPSCWLNFLNSLKENDTALYLDPDAFLCNDTLLKLVDDIEDHALNKKIIKYGDSDAGIALLRNTSNTREMLNNVQSTLNDPHISCNIEQYYDKHFKGKNQYYIPWKKASIYLHGNICGDSNKIDCIHGSDKRVKRGQILDDDYYISDNILCIAKQTEFESDIIDAFHIMYEKECIRNY